MKKIIVCVLVFIALFSYGAVCNAKTIQRDGKWYEGEEYEKLKQEEEAKVREVAEKLILAFLMDDYEEASEISYYRGFTSHKYSLLKSYYDYEYYTLMKLKIISIKMGEDIETATVGVKVYLSTVDTIGGLSTAPIRIEKWDFIYKDKKWLFKLE